MDKITEALSKLLPQDQIKEVSMAIADMMKEEKAKLDADYNSKLEEAYADLTAELKDSEKKGEEGYTQAYSIISDLRNRLDIQQKEFEATQLENFDQAYKKIEEERNKNNTIAEEMYDEYNNKLKEMKEYVVDKVDQFLQLKGSEIYETAKRDILNDPRMVEHKVALDKIVEVTADYLDMEKVGLIAGNKLETINKQLEEVTRQLRAYEAKNIRLSNDNTKLTENLRRAGEKLNENNQVITETKKVAVKNSQKERIEKAKNVQGRGRVTDDSEVIKEHSDDSQELNELLVLAGMRHNQ